MYSQALVGAVYVLVLASILLTHLLKAFTAAEVCAVLAFIAGLLLLRSGWHGLSHTRRAIVLGSALGLSGVLVKLFFVFVLGIGGEHASHDGTHPLLLHIHHLFFNIGFLFVIYAAFSAVLARWRAPR
jgi:hypothetical protein